MVASAWVIRVSYLFDVIEIIFSIVKDNDFWELLEHVYSG